MMFAPHSAGKPQRMTHDAMKDCIMLKIQKEFKDGNDTAKAVINGDDNTPGTEPERTEVEHAATDSAEPHMTKNPEVEQAGCDLLHTEEIREHNERKKSFANNMIKAHELTCSLCIKTMQSRIDEMSDFESEIKNKPIKLLEATKATMATAQVLLPKQ